ncbi:DNA topoisomerase IV subunit B [Spiroplasma cantharicola]|uniref:DNA topoisomerase (ATP-hydrolyzing) n=1 Tax=Spiroplasma cantharicola TaxID=362837 RepID=A0A0M3SJA3_9MOLU|nr:DNA topoisomerase IV subunit B [Spiroplasma cantharicola]ALD66384.1 DNA topoisomerase IV subunit B [Spiroplasma cantharicola]
MAENNKNLSYTEDSIQILEGLEAVRKRPGMYIGSTDSRGLHHLVWEIVDNSIDEALAGVCSEINVSIEKDGSVTVKDNGRGVPIGSYKGTNQSTPEIIFSVLHAGGKFGGDGYKTSGGLHGVGSSVVNALSSKFKVIIHRDGVISQIKFAHGGKLVDQLKQTGTSKQTGTTVNFLPDETMFSTTKFSFSTISERLKESALLNSGLKLTLKDNRSDKYVEYLYENGLTEFVNELRGDQKALCSPIMLKGSEQNIDVEIALTYTSDFSETVLGFANNVKTSDGGTHVTGFRSGLVKALNEYGKNQSILKEKDKKLDSSDIKEGLIAIVTVKIPESLIQYEGQTKGKLGTSEARYACEKVTEEHFSFWLQENKTIAISIIEKALLARRAKEEARKARQAVRDQKSKSKSRTMLGKLTPAQGKNKQENELYLVEGDSAGGSAKSGRDRKFQAILPLRGKVINAEKTKLIDLLKNEEITTIINAIGAGIGSDFDISDINYGKIILMTDADTDGAHIQTLLLTFFYRYMKELIVNKNIYIAMPPLFKITTGSNKKDFMYLWTEEELASHMKKTKAKIEIQRYKGLGEMNADQLWETTMDPEHRKLIQVTINDALAAENSFRTLMGDNSEKRKEWIEENVKFTLEENTEFI